MPLHVHQESQCILSFIHLSNETRSQVQRRLHVQQDAELRHHAQDPQELPVLPVQAVREGGHEAQLGARRQRLQDRQGEIRIPGGGEEGGKF